MSSNASLYVQLGKNQTATVDTRYVLTAAKVTNVWLVNLAVADLIFCLTQIFSIYNRLTGNWPFGLFLCQCSGFLKYTNMFCSVFLLAVISAERALCIWQPVFMKRRRTLFAARVVAVCVWVASIIFSSPYFVYRKIYTRRDNSTPCVFNVKHVGADVVLALNLNRFLCGFVLPFMVILACYIFAGVGIRRTRLVGKSRPLRILASLVIAFFLCWAPYHCILLLRTLDSKNKIVKIWYPLASGMAYFNSCVNPILYFCMGLEVRGRFRQSLTGVYKRALAEDLNGQTTQSFG
ncbi:formyl peptide receptor 2-like isoform X2 [Nelusetta ayraudi]|uniref:formyl peptide receptor 2-like isoform X2 n=1 Tax=Nelusetta ayraudi TaxID=303726 RepID=UPI003F6F88AB